MIARDVWVHPALALNVWGRVGTTLAFAAPSAAGLGAARAAALAMSGATVLVTTLVARELGVRSLALVPVFLWFQPWFHLYANAVLTEVPFSLVMISACWAGLTDRLALASVLFGLLPLIRHEGIALLGLWLAYLMVLRRPPLVALAVLPLVAYQAAFSVVYSTAPFAIYFRARPTAAYGRGGWFHYVLPIARSVGPAVGLAALAGAVELRHNRRFLLVAAPYAVYVLAEVVIFRFGLFGSGGNANYLLPVAPLAAIAATAAADRVLALRRVGLAAALVLLLITIGWGLRTAPARADGAALAMRDAVRLLERRHADADAVIATHPWYFEMSGARLPVGDGLRSPWSRPTRPPRIPAHRFVVWDRYYSNRFGLRWRRMRAPRFTQLARFGGGRVVVLRRR